MQGCVDVLHVHLRGQERPSAEYPAEIQTLGDHIRKHQLDLGLLQKQVAVQLPTTPRAHNWESGHISPGFWCFSAIRLFLGYLPIPDTGTLADELEVHRFVRGWSQKEAARDLGVDPEHAGEVGAWGVGARRGVRSGRSRMVGGAVPPTLSRRFAHLRPNFRRVRGAISTC